MRQIPYCDLEMIQTIWEGLEVPLVLHFDAPSINICKKSKSLFLEVHSRYERRCAKFFNMVLKEDIIQMFFEEYGFLRFPAMLIYDYGKIQFKWNSYHEMEEEFELSLKKVLADA